jgi:hypothetical protein
VGVTAQGVPLPTPVPVPVGKRGVGVGGALGVPHRVPPVLRVTEAEAPVLPVPPHTVRVPLLNALERVAAWEAPGVCVRDWVPPHLEGLGVPVEFTVVEGAAGPVTVPVPPPPHPKGVWEGGPEVGVEAFPATPPEVGVARPKRGVPVGALGVLDTVEV